MQWILNTLFPIGMVISPFRYLWRWKHTHTHMRARSLAYSRARARAITFPCTRRHARINFSWHARARARNGGAQGMNSFLPLPLTEPPPNGPIRTSKHYIHQRLFLFYRIFEIHFLFRCEIYSDEVKYRSCSITNNEKYSNGQNTCPVKSFPNLNAIFVSYMYILRN